MIARANTGPAPRPTVSPGTASMVGTKRPLPHRFHLTGGRVIEGDLHRSPGGRLADHLSMLKGFISITAARCTQSGSDYGYLVLNQDHVMFIEELAAGECRE